MIDLPKLNSQWIRKGQRTITYKFRLRSKYINRAKISIYIEKIYSYEHSNQEPKNTQNMP